MHIKHRWELEKSIVWHSRELQRMDHARIPRERLSSYRQTPLASIEMDGVLHYTPRTA